MHLAAQTKWRELLGEGCKQLDLVLAREGGSNWKLESLWIRLGPLGRVQDQVAACPR